MKKSSKDLGISERILLIRKHFNLSYDGLADRIGASGQGIANIEQGKSNNPGAELLVNMATILGIRLDWLLLGEGEMLKSEAPADENVQHSGTPPRHPAGAGEEGISATLTDNEPDGPDAEEPGFSYGEKLPRRVGMDVVDQLAQYGTDIRQLQAAVRKLQKQLKS